MAYYRSAGTIPQKRHTQHRAPDGALYFEELMGAEGFSSDSSLLYHRRIPSAVSDFKTWQPPDQSTVPNHPLVPLHLRTHALFDDTAQGADAVRNRRLLLGNTDVRLYYVVADSASPYYRSAIGDECLYIESGSATVETQFGDLRVADGDYTILPRATTYRVVPDGVVRVFAIEADSHIRPPRNYLSKFGQLLENAPYCERDLRGPSDPYVVDETNVEVYIKHRGASAGGATGTIHLLPHHPFDVVGWDGCLYPYALSIHDFMPITGKIHQPPPAHQVFEGRNFVVCNFVPRKVDYPPLAIPVPYYHSNVDSDEVMFYCGGDYAARAGSGISGGSVSLHPGGHPHGPQPGAYERSIGTTEFNEFAVMVDTFRPLELGEAALASSDPAYVHSWSEGTPSSARRDDSQ